MAEEHQNFEVYAGSDLSLDFSLTWEDGDPYDITSSVITWVAATKAGREPFLAKEIGTGIVLIHAEGEADDPAVFQLVLVPDDTAELLGLYYHETRVDGMPVASGTMYVLPSSSREFGS
jgi:hypothetical protein